MERKQQHYTEHYCSSNAIAFCFRKKASNGWRMDVSPLKYVWHHCDISLSRSSESPNLRAGSKCIIYQPWSMGWRCKVRSQCSCSSSPNPTFLIYKCVGPPPPLRWRWQRIIHHSSRLLMKISSLNSPCFAKKTLETRRLLHRCRLSSTCDNDHNLLL